MRAIPHWQTFLAGYDRLTLANMSVHHLDVLRFLFGDPDEIYTAARTDPRTQFAHSDGITRLDLDASRPARSPCRSRTSGPGHAQDGFEGDIYIKWRVEGTDGRRAGHDRLARLSGGGLDADATPRRRTTGGKWVSPTWTTMWFPARFHRRDGAAAIRGEDGNAAELYPSPTT